MHLTDRMLSSNPILRISTALASLLLSVPEASQMLNTTLKTAVHREPKKQVWLFSIYENENRKISWQITETVFTSGLVEFEYMNMDTYREAQREIKESWKILESIVAINLTYETRQSIYQDIFEKKK